MSRRNSPEMAHGYGQGKDTSTVLTNRSDFLTVIAENSYHIRKTKLDLPERHRKGNRPMHKTTLTFDTKPTDSPFVSCMKESFSGRKDLIPSSRPPKCPSLHTSNFDIGLTQERLRETNHKLHFASMDVKHPTKIHEDNKRWKEQMSGREMEQTTRHCNSKQMDLESTYKCIHDRLGTERGPGVLHPAPTPQYYDIINGSPIAPPSNDHRLISGNRILHNMRETMGTTSIIS